MDMNKQSSIEQGGETVLARNTDNSSLPANVLDVSVVPLFRAIRGALPRKIPT